MQRSGAGICWIEELLSVYNKFGVFQRNRMPCRDMSTFHMASWFNLSWINKLWTCSGKNEDDTKETPVYVFSSENIIFLWISERIGTISFLELHIFLLSDVVIVFSNAGFRFWWRHREGVIRIFLQTGNSSCEIVSAFVSVNSRMTRNPWWGNTFWCDLLDERKYVFSHIIHELERNWCVQRLLGWCAIR